jgi:hypothetical protein
MNYDMIAKGYARQSFCLAQSESLQALTSRFVLVLVVESGQAE